jgi:hypothetical protein
VPFLEACRLGRLERTAIDQLFAEARAEQRQSPAAEISESELRYLARSYFHRLEVGAAAVPLDAEERVVSERFNLEDLMAVSQREIDVSMETTAIAFAKWAKVSVSEGTPAFGKLCVGIRQAEIEHYARQADRLALQQPRFANSLSASQYRLEQVLCQETGAVRMITDGG